MQVFRSEHLCIQNRIRKSVTDPDPDPFFNRNQIRVPNPFFSGSKTLDTQILVCNPSSKGALSGAIFFFFFSPVRSSVPKWFLVVLSRS